MVELINVSFSYKGNEVIKDVNFKADEGKFYLITGKNGSGKTTLLDLIFGFLKPDSGKVLFNGNEVKNVLSKEAAYLITDAERYFFEKTVVDEVSYPLRFFGFSHDEAKKRAEKILNELGIHKEFFDRDPLTLSKGEKRRISLASVLLLPKKLLLLDEPLSGLDLSGKHLVLEVIKKVLQKNHTVIATAQVPDDFLPLKPEVLILSNGKLLKVDFEEPEKAVLLFKKEGMPVPQKLVIASIIKEKRKKDIDIFCEDLDFVSQVTKAVFEK